MNQLTTRMCNVLSASLMVLMMGVCLLSTAAAQASWVENGSAIILSGDDSETLSTAVAGITRSTSMDDLDDGIQTGASAHKTSGGGSWPQGSALRQTRVFKSFTWQGGGSPTTLTVRAIGTAGGTYSVDGNYYNGGNIETNATVTHSADTNPVNVPNMAVSQGTMLVAGGNTVSQDVTYGTTGNAFNVFVVSGITYGAYVKSYSHAWGTYSYHIGYGFNAFAHCTLVITTPDF